jgi:hypothetical protein
MGLELEEVNFEGILQLLLDPIGIKSEIRTSDMSCSILRCKHADHLTIMNAGDTMLPTGRLQETSKFLQLCRSDSFSHPR